MTRVIFRRTEFTPAIIERVNFRKRGSAVPEGEDSVNTRFGFPVLHSSIKVSNAAFFPSRAGVHRMLHP